MQALATTVSAITAVCALLVSITVYKGQLFELARSLHQDLTTGPVEEARDVVGAVVHGYQTLDPETIPGVRTAHFRILWCFERIYAGRARIGNSWLVGRPAQQFLDRMILWHVHEWHNNFELKEFRAKLDQALRNHGMGKLQDTDSYKAFKNLVKDLEPQWESPPQREERSSGAPSVA